MSSWESIRLGGEEVQLMIHPSKSGKFQVGAKFDSSDEEGYLALLKEDDVCWFRRPPEPRSVGVSEAGDVVLADWIEYGESTGATVSVFDRDEARVFESHMDVSAPTVDISSDGDFVVVCPYGEPARVLDIQRNTEVVWHEYDIADRLVPQWRTVDGESQVEFCQKSGEDPLYRINLDGKITWSSDSFESQQYYQIVTLDESVPWAEVIEDFADDYRNSDDDEVKDSIANTIGDARLVDANSTILQEVVSALTDVRSTFADNEAHERLVAQALGEAFYRLAKDLRSGVSIDEEFWQLIDRSAAEYRTVLPWYEGKKGLSRRCVYKPTNMRSKTVLVKPAVVMNRSSLWRYDST